MNFDLSTILQILKIVGEVQGALSKGGNTITIIKNLAPTLMPILQTLGGTMFPQADPAHHVAAAVDLIFDHDGTSWVQNGLNRLGQSPVLVVDGNYGPKTKAAVSAYQSAHGLKVDGWSGPKTSASMAIELAKLPPLV